MLKEIKGLYDLGFSIILIKRNSKIPLNSGWTKGPKIEWKSLVNQYKNGMNLGVRLGSTSKVGKYYLGVIDCDVKSSKPEFLDELNESLESLNLESTPIVISGRGNGSKHFYVLSENPLKPKKYAISSNITKVLMPSVKPSKKELAELSIGDLKKGYRLRPAWEISIMGEGQQVVLPPSIHPDSKKPYRWKLKEPKNEKDFFVLESDLLEKSLETEEKENYIKKTDYDFPTVDLKSKNLSDFTISQIKDGEGIEDRSEAIYKIAIEMVNSGFSESEILSVLTNKEYYLGQTAYDHAKTKDRVKAAEWIRRYTIKAANQATNFENFSEFENRENLDLDESKIDRQFKDLTGDSDWRSKITRSKKGFIFPTFENIKVILNGEAGEKYISYDVFCNRAKWTVDTPWGSKKDSEASDHDLILCKGFLSRKYFLDIPIYKIQEVITFAYLKNQFHPVKNYLKSLTWDKVPRVNKWLKTYMNAKGNDAYIETIGTKTLVAMIKRIYEPGCKFDTVLILEGAEGIKKSTALQTLSRPWFKDAAFSINDKDSILKMEGAWIYELGELSALSKADINQLKAFITVQVDRIRPPFGRLVKDFPRQSIFIGSTNEDEYLRGRTGNRRYWPIKVNKIDTEGIERDRDQLLAEALFLYKKGFTTWIDDPKVLEIAVNEQSKRLDSDSLEDVILDFFETEEGKNLPRFFRLLDLLESPFFIQYKNDRQTQIRFSDSLRKLGLKKISQRTDAGPRKFWIKKDN